MAKKTKQQQNLETLTSMGWRVTETRSSKYIALQHHMMIGKVFLGKAGAVRVGRVASNTASSTIERVVAKTKELEIAGI